MYRSHQPIEKNEDIEIKFLADCLEHIPYLVKLWYEQISRHWSPTASTECANENLLKHANKNQLPLTLVALNDDQPLGMASLRENDGIQPHRSPWLGSLVVAPLYRKQKIGEQLIKAVNRQASLLSYEKIYLLAFDPTIPSWYAKLDWDSIGDDQLFGHRVSVMEFKLAKTES
jgi:N-acetylglutamate synthase-like GNAT family acetyltransferase